MVISQNSQSLSNDCSVAANRVKQFKVLIPLLVKQPPVMITHDRYRDGNVMV